MGRRRLWLFVLWTCVFLFAIRCGFAVATAPWSLAWVGALLALLYLLFLVEGMHGVAAQLEAAGLDSARRFIAQDTSFNGDARARALRICESLESRRARFVSGREFVAITAVVSIALIFQALPFDGDALVRALPYALNQRLLLGEVVARAMTSVATAILVATLLPFWISQLLPQLLAEQRAVAFLRLVPVETVVRLCIRIGRLQIGAPSSWLEAFIARRSWFGGKRALPVGGARVLHALAHYFGIYVTQRKIEIDASDCIVKDTSTLRFTGPCDEIQQMVRVSSSEVALRGWSYTLPGGLKYESRPKVAFFSLDELQEAASATSADGRKDGASDSGRGDLSRRQLAAEYIFVLEMPLDVAIPREGRDHEDVTIGIEYGLRAFNAELDEAEPLYFDITKPTDSLVITVKHTAEQFIREPTLHYVLSDEMMVLSRFRRQQPIDCKAVQIEDGWLISVSHPPFGSRLKLDVDLRRLTRAS